MLLGFLFIYSGLVSDTINLKEPAKPLQDVIVTATKKSASAFDIPYSTGKIKKTEMQGLQYRTTPEAMLLQPGVFVQKTNHGGGSPFIRGFTGNQTLLLIDGIRVNNSTYRFGPNQYFNTVDIFSVANIEIVRGTGSVQYGSDAIGGVVQVFTNTPSFSTSKKWYGSLQLRGVSRNIEQSARADIAYSSTKLVIQGGITRRNFGDLPGGDTTGTQTPSGYKELNYDIKLSWKPTNNVLVSALHQQVTQKNVPLYHRVRLENFEYYFFSPQVRKLSYVRTEITTQHKIFTKLSFTASLQRQEETRTYRRNGNANRFQENDQVRTVGLTADFFSVWSPTMSSNTGVEFYGDLVNSNRYQINNSTQQATLQRGLYPNGARMNNYAIYSLHHLNWRSWKIEAGIRYNALSILLNDTATTVPALGAIKVTPSSLVANASVLHQFSKTHAVYASFSTGYRSPNIDDMGTLGLVDFRYELPAYSLKPEKSYNTEIGYKYNSKCFYTTASLFYMHLNNLITRTQVPNTQIGGYNVYVKENSQESYVRGAELDVGVQATSSIRVRLHGTYTFGQNMSRNEPMRRIPPAFGRLLLTKNWRKFQLHIDQQFAGKQSKLAQGDKDDNRIPTGGTPGWYTMHIMTQYSWSALQIQLGWINVFNKDYRMHGSGINGQGSSASFTVQWKISKG